MRFQKTQILSLVNQKGGCGKTSSTVSIGAAFAKLGYSVCLVDTDPQCNLSHSFKVEPEDLVREGRFTLADAFLLKRAAADIKVDFPDRFPALLSLLPGHRGLSSVSNRLEAQLQAAIANGELSALDADDVRNEHRARLGKALDSLRGTYDVVILDTPPNLDFLMTSALIASDWFIIPCFPSEYDLSGLETLIRTVNKVRERFKPDLRLAGVLLGNYDRSATLDRQIHELLKKRFGREIVFQSTIARSVRFREATFMQKTIFEHPDGSAHAQQYLDLVQEMINRGAKGIVGQTVNPLPNVSDLVRVANG